MKKTLFIFLTVLVLIPNHIFAAEFPRGAVTIIGTLDTDQIILDHSVIGDFTLLRQDLGTKDGDADVLGYQGGQILCDNVLFQQAYFHVGSGRPFTGTAHTTQEGNLVCTGNLVYQHLGGQGVYYEITYIPYSIVAGTSTIMGTMGRNDPPSYSDWLFVSSVGLFLLSFVAWGYFASIFKPKPSYS